ncbi:hypothetical protein M5K25_019662 [Dendrobium thyrsiflorum]|uniref:Uncharacterized protein n=2 Tax=Dendrobium TaxID=37818 RepID=A0ABD0UFR2_DENTH|nr:hypothetical protein IEQ34_016904 [Dendrobium chrysotoxum]
MEWWDRMVFPMKQVWIRVALRFRVRKTGLWKLRQEVSTCEYEDVHVMWEILQRTDTEISTLSRRRRSGARWSVFESGPHRLCGSF